MPRKHTSAKHTRYQLPADCSNKRGFATEKLAQRAAEEQELLSPQANLRVYKCPLCAKWHLTSTL